MATVAGAVIKGLFWLAVIGALVGKAAEKARLRRENAGLKARLQNMDSQQGIVTEDPAMDEAEARVMLLPAVRVGWDVDGAEGFVYTTDFSGAPVVRTRLHWDPEPNETGSPVRRTASPRSGPLMTTKIPPWVCREYDGASSSNAVTLERSFDI